MSLKWFLTALIICISVGLSAQVDDSVWGVSGKRYLGDGFKNWKPELILDGRRTIVGEESARLFGLRLGVEHKRVHRWGLGLYGLDAPIVRTDLPAVEGEVEKVIFQFNYVSTYYERVLYFNRKWEWSAAAHLGSGNITTDYKLVDEESFLSLEPIVVKPIELSTSGYFNPTWWASVGGGVGYRFMNETPPEIKQAYNGFIYIFKIKIKFGKMVRSIFNKEVKDEY